MLLHQIDMQTDYWHLREVRHHVQVHLQGRPVPATVHLIGM